MRIFPTAVCSCAGNPDAGLIKDQGNHCPTEHAMIWMIHAEMHHAPKYWKPPEELPRERWLVEPEHELNPMRGAWRSFERGPRNCIAQGLVMTKLRVFLGLTVREFDIQPAYRVWDAKQPPQPISTYRGERAYQAEEGAAHPADRYPYRASLANK